MDSEVRKYDRVVRRYNSELFARRNENGIISVLQKQYRYIPYQIDEDTTIYKLTLSPHHVFAITDTWTTQGRSVPLGIEVVLNKVREVTRRNYDELIRQIEEQEEREEESRQRDIRNTAEAFFSDQRSRFAKATSDILTHSMEKKNLSTERRRRNKDGNSKSKL